MEHISYSGQNGADLAGKTVQKGPRAYLDWNATAPIRIESAAAAGCAMALGNPSSQHNEGRAARAAVEKARASVAALAGVEAGQVTFTSGGTEAAVMALQPIHASELLLAGATEHACIRSGGRFPKDSIREMPLDSFGRFDQARFDAWFSTLEIAPGLAHIALQAANNETGVLNDPEALKVLRGRGFTVTCDCVQAAGRTDISAFAEAADFIFLSAHKIGGPKGVGAIIARKDACGGLRPLIIGGGQERGARGGTENVAGIVGFGVAAAVAKDQLAEMPRIAAMRDSFETGVRAIAPDAVFFGTQVPRLANTSLFAIPGLRAETALIACDLDGVAVSSGSACSSGKVGRSHVLKAMGVSNALAECAIRVSMGWTTTQDDLFQCIDSLSRQIARSQSRKTAA